MTKPITPRTPASLVEPAINKGTAFTETERRMLGLTGRLPSAVLTLEAQAERLWAQLQRLPDDLARNLLLEQIHNRNEVLYFKVLAEHLTELLPVVYDPTVGDAIEQYSDVYRGQRGVYLSFDRPDDIETAFSTLGLGPDDVDIVVCSDAEQILGIGDWGVGGIEIASGKLAIYTAGGGIDPSRTIPVSLDVGTDNQTLLDDPFYLGNRHERRPGADYDAFIARYVETVHRLSPKAFLHFEDFGPEHAHTVLTRYSPEYCVFNDDIRGTGAVVMAATYSAADITGTALRAAGIPVAPAEYGGATYTFGQADSILVFPGLGLGVKVARATRVTKAMFAAAARAVSSQVDVSAAGAPILPDVASLRELSAVVAQAVCAAAISDGVATEKHDDVSKAIRQIMWIPAYRCVTP